MSWFLFLLIFYFGACIGSFLNVVILRLPKNKPLTGRSHCLCCRHVLSFLELIPLFSFLFLKRKCKICKTAISWRYFIIELVTAFLFLITYLIQQPHILFDYLFYLKSIILVSVLVVVFVIDLEHFLILDKVLVAFGLPLLVLNLTLDKLNHQALFSLTSLTTGGLFSAFVFSSAFFLLWLVSKGLWIGLGDVKLMLFLGIALGWPNTLICWFLAFVLGTIYALPLLVLGKKKLTSKVPFGVFLSLSALICLYAGRSILGWYLSFLGF